MNLKTVSIGGAITAAITAAIMAYFTPHVLLWIGIVIGLDIGATLLSWTYTQVRKITRFPNKALWKLDKNRVWIMWRAINSGFLFALLNGVAFTFFTNPLEGKQIAAVAVLWILNCALVGMSSPFTWVWTFKHLLPLLNRRVDAAGIRVDRDAAGKVVGIKDGNDDTVMVGRKGNHELAEEGGDEAGGPDGGAGDLGGGADAPAGGPREA